MNKEQSLSILNMCHIYMELCDQVGVTPAQYLKDAYNALSKDIGEIDDD